MNNVRITFGVVQLVALNEETVKLRGIGSNRVTMMGSLEISVLVNEEELRLRILNLKQQTSRMLLELIS